MPKHGQGVNVVDDNQFVSSVDELASPLMTIKRNMLQAYLFWVLVKVATYVCLYQMAICY